MTWITTTTIARRTKSRKRNRIGKACPTRRLDTTPGGHGRTGASLPSTGMTIRFCDDLDRHGFSWIVEEPLTRTSHALATGQGVWLIDPVDWPEAIDRATSLGTPTGVVQLLDRHNRDAAAVAERLGVPHLRVPQSLPGTPFEVIEVRRTKRWQEIALWWPEPRVLVVAESL